ncbi:dihydroxyacetone kinase subunit DhaK [Yinghuangia seranimata]|uniref:dihydroxyacetone kinase subunit DhaK n=1 Tax=Yinghuangia seranimata TaxID=408067 RepID=UPI00248B6BD8|nr:dihydroxyacetone kinase subunit DhaK [Yinghuangia seranimata]MDI2130263.1 dihydroxyacetone kinase subunit DhaK [Yinghuangia seranimata]
MKKLLNDPESAVADALAGLAASRPELMVDQEHRVVTRRAGVRPGKVGLVSGGGSGHEPLHSGYVGLGMLDAACAGEVFSAPTPDRILVATRAVSAGAGVVHIVKNYTGDNLSFDMAAELAREEGIEVEKVLVDDDVAVEESTWSAGRRGTGATVVVEKVAGARAEAGGDLKAVADTARRADAMSRSFAVALRAGTVPAAGRPGFDLPEDEIEIGVGIHGEPGRRRGPLRPARALVADMLDAVLADLPETSDPVVAVVSGLGATPLLELYVVYGHVAEELARRGVAIARNLVGNYVTSLDMAGVSITLCRADAELLRLWDAPVDTPALRWG